MAVLNFSAKITEPRSFELGQTGSLKNITFKRSAHCLTEALSAVDCMVWTKYNILHFGQNPQTTASAANRW